MAYLRITARNGLVLYDMRQIPDPMNVYYRGRLVATTNQRPSALR